MVAVLMMVGILLAFSIGCELDNIKRQKRLNRIWNINK